MRPLELEGLWRPSKPWWRPRRRCRASRLSLQTQASMLSLLDALAG